jgi:hypothetical protein
LAKIEATFSHGKHQNKAQYQKMHHLDECSQQEKTSSILWAEGQTLCKEKLCTVNTGEKLLNPGL